MNKAKSPAQAQDNAAKLLKKAFINTVKCIKCGKLHETDAQSYLSFYGNVLVGSSGGVVGDNLDANMTVVKITIACRNVQCVKKLLLEPNSDEIKVDVDLDEDETKPVKKPKKATRTRDCDMCGESYRNCDCDDED